jgi:hypothetical protein
LFSLRTGVFPDRAGEANPIPQQAGIPFRAIQPENDSGL